MAGQQQQSLWCCFNVLRNSIKMTDRLQPASLQLSSECPKEVSTLLMPLDIQKSVVIGFHTV